MITRRSVLTTSLWLSILAVACSDGPTGSGTRGEWITVVVSTTGACRVDSLTILFDDSLSRAIGINDTTTFDGLDMLHQHRLELTGVPADCLVVLGENPRQVFPTYSVVGREKFEVRCPCDRMFGPGIYMARDPYVEHPGGVFRVDVDGGGAVSRLTSDRDEYAQPSPDGRMLAHGELGQGCGLEPCSSGAGGTIVIEDACGGRYVDEGGRVVEWSPDGQRVLAAASGGLQWMNADGSGRTLLEGVTNLSTWSPDGSKIAYHRNDGDIYVIDADGSNVVNLTNDPVRQGYPDWSPDGMKIAYQQVADSSLLEALLPDTAWIYYHDIWVMAADGSDPICVACGTGDELAPVWSPDSSKLAFQLWNRLGDDTWERGIYVMNADGSNPTRVAYSTFNFAWSPDGGRIAFGMTDVFVVNADGTGEQRLTDHPAREEVWAWSAGGP